MLLKTYAVEKSSLKHIELKCSVWPLKCENRSVVFPFFVVATYVNSTQEFLHPH